MKVIVILGCMGLLMVSCTNSPQKEVARKEQLLAMTAPSGQGSSLPHLTLGGDQNLYMSWVEEGDSQEVTLKYSRFTNEEEWTSPEVIATGKDWFVNWADYPMIAVDELGNVLAHYLRKSAPETFSYDVIVRFKPANGNWSEPEALHKDGTETEHGFVTMLPITGGGFQVAWLDGRNTGGGDGHAHHGAMSLRTTTVSAAGVISVSIELDSKTCDCCQTGGILTKQGPIFVYRDRSDLELRDMNIVRKVGDEWTTPKLVFADNWEINGCPVNGPRVDAVGNNLAMAWYTSAGNNPQVKVIFSGDGGESFEEPVVIDNERPLGRVDVIMIDQNQVIVSWLATGKEQSLIKAQMLSRNGEPGKSWTVAETTESRSSGFPQMAKVGNQVVFAWTHLTENESVVRMAGMEL